MSFLYFMHTIMYSFRGMRKSYVCKEVFDSLRTVRSSNVFEREAVNGRRCFFDNYRVTHFRACLHGGGGPHIDEVTHLIVVEK